MSRERSPSQSAADTSFAILYVSPSALCNSFHDTFSESVALFPGFVFRGQRVDPCGWAGLDAPPARSLGYESLCERLPRQSAADASFAILCFFSVGYMSFIPIDLFEICRPFSLGSFFSVSGLRSGSMPRSVANAIFAFSFFASSALGHSFQETYSAFLAFRAGFVFLCG